MPREEDYSKREPVPRRRTCGQMPRIGRHVKQKPKPMWETLAEKRGGCEERRPLDRPVG